MTKRLLFLITVLKLTIFGTMALTFYNMAYEQGYEHGVIAGFWKFDAPQEIKDLYNKKKDKK